MFAHTPLAKSSRETLTTSTCIILNLRVGLTMSMYPKCSLRVVLLGTIVPQEETAVSFIDFAERCSTLHELTGVQSLSATSLS
jgi:hypothetical protein